MLLNPFIIFLQFKMAAKERKWLCLHPKRVQFYKPLKQLNTFKECLIELLAYAKEIFKINEILI